MSSDEKPRRHLLRYVLRVCGGCVALSLLAVFGPTLFVLTLSLGRTHDTVGETPARDVAMILGAGLNPDGTPSPFLRARLDLGADLYDGGKAKVIIVSGAVDGYYNEPRAMKRYLMTQRGIPEARIVTDNAGYNTWSSCVRAKKIFGVDSLTVVTQGYHLPRSVAACRLAKVDAEGLGDTSVKTYSRPWRFGQVREIGANIKLVYDWARNAQPALGAPRDDVEVALRGA